MIVNPRLANLQESATLRINNTALQKRQIGQDVFHFGFGQSPFPVPEQMQRSLCANADKKAYLPGLGLTELRQSIAGFLRQYFGYELDYEHIAIGPGSKELLFDLLYILEGTVLIPSPSWVSYKPIAQLLDKKVVSIPTHFDDRFKLNVDELKRALEQNPDQQYILILNAPSNPTGQVYNATELSAIADLCRAYNVHVVSDEIYALINFNQAKDNVYQASIQNYLPEQTYVTGGLSKAFCAGGWRLGFMTYPDPLFGKALQTLVSETFSCTSAPIQHAAISAFEMSDSVKTYVQETSDILRIVSEYCHNALNQMAVRCHPSGGGFYLFIDFEAYRSKLNALNIHTSQQWCDQLLAEYGIALLPGTDFGRNAEELSARFAYVDFDGQALIDAYRSNKQQFQADIAQHIPNMVKGLNVLKQALQAID